MIDNIIDIFSTNKHFAKLSHFCIEIHRDPQTDVVSSLEND